MKRFVFAALLSWVCSLQGQNLNYVRYLVDTLCGPTMAGRGYVDDGLGRAAEFITAQFDSLGLEPVNEIHYQTFNHSVNTFPHEPVLRVNGQHLEAGRDFLVNAHSPSLRGMFNVVHLDTTYIDRPGDIILVEESIYIVHPVSPENRDGASKRAGLVRELAEFVPVMDPVSKLTWSVASALYNFPVIEVDEELVDWSQADSVFLELFSEFKPSFESRNVFAMVPGTVHPDSFLVFTAHYDHLGKMGHAIFPGANDNASGTAMLLDLAAHYVKNPLKYSVLFIAFAGEEAGLVGSKYFVDNPLIPLENITFLINLDLTGNGEEGITVVNGKMFEEDFKRLAAINSDNEFVSKIRARGAAANSDHYWFSKNGVPAFFIYTLGERTAYHDIYDVPETLYFGGYDGLFALVVKFVEETEVMRWSK